MRCVLVALALAALAGCSSAPPTTPVATASLPAAAPLFVAPQEVPLRAHAAIVVDVRTGKVLHQNAAQSPRYPASLTKMMTLYMLFEQLEAGRLTPGSPLAVSAEAASRPASKLGLDEGATITVDTAARALAVRSANDVAVVVAENLAGSEEAFALAMTRKARALGMSRTVFVNASGLPDPGQVTTARDMAILGKALSEKFPRSFRYFSTREFTYGKRTYKSTNKLLGKVRGVNGIKTGYIRNSGYNLVASVERDGKHIIVVVIGGKSGAARNKRVEALIEEYMPRASGGGMFANIF